MAYIPPNPNGQASSANSAPVVIASDQSEVPVTQSVSALDNGSKTVTTAGTDVALAASTACKWVTIEAYRANTGLIAVGGSGVDATAATGTGILLAAGDSCTINVNNLAAVYIDAEVSGEGVRFAYGV